MVNCGKNNQKGFSFEVINDNSPFTYSPTGHVIARDLNIIDNENLRKVLAKDPKYREPQSKNWKYKFKLLME
jgi:hypothetical protein